MSNFIGVVCGLKSEAAAVRAASADADLGTARIRIGVSGANAARAAGVALQLVKEGASALLSVGVSGGLDPALAPGDLIVADSLSVKTILGGAAEAPQDEVAKSAAAGAGVNMHPQLKERVAEARPEGLAARLGRSVSPILGVDDIVAGVGDKARLFAQTGAVAVDMESHVVARIAAAHALGFLAVRAIADPAQRAMPQAALKAVAADGSTKVLSTLMECAKRPSDFPKLLQLGKDSEAALATLRQELRAILSAVAEHSP